MKLFMRVTMTVLCALMVGCAENAQKSQDTAAVNEELVSSLNDMAIQNAIISQHTLFPYHFVENSAELNELGRHDFAVLAKHFMGNPGQLNIRRDNVPEALYKARVNFVADRCKQAGVGAERILILDGMPGGSGMASERVLTILADTSKPAATKMKTSSSYSATGMK
jgi:hypothetical protein